MDLKSEATALRAGLIAGCVGIEDAVAWADRLILNGQAIHVPQALDLSLLRPNSEADAISLLGEVQGEADPRRVGVEVCGWLLQRLLDGTASTQQAARTLYLLMQEDCMPDPEFESMAYYFDDGVDLAELGISGTVESVRTEMIEYLRAIAAAPAV